VNDIYWVLWFPVLHPKRQPAGTNPCKGENNGGCSDLCLIGLGRVAECRCPHRKKMSPDNKTCVGKYCFSFNLIIQQTKQYNWINHFTNSASKILKRLKLWILSVQKGKVRIIIYTYIVLFKQKKPHLGKANETWKSKSKIQTRVFFGAFHKHALLLHDFV